MVLIWLKSFGEGGKVAIHCSDVCGGFDRVGKERFSAKLKSKKIRPVLLEVMLSWLRRRKAHVVVGGDKSEEFHLAGMFFQSTV